MTEKTDGYAKETRRSRLEDVELGRYKYIRCTALLNLVPVLRVLPTLPISPEYHHVKQLEEKERDFFFPKRHLSGLKSCHLNQ